MISHMYQTCWDATDHTEPLGMPRDPVTPDLEPTLSVAAFVSQLEHLTANVEQLVSRMDAKERRLGDPHAATRPPPAPPNGQLPDAPPYQPDMYQHPSPYQPLSYQPESYPPPPPDYSYPSNFSFPHLRETAQFHQLYDQNQPPVNYEYHQQNHNLYDPSAYSYGSSDIMYHANSYESN